MGSYQCIYLPRWCKSGLEYSILKMIGLNPWLVTYGSQRNTPVRLLQSPCQTLELRLFVPFDGSASQTNNWKLESCEKCNTTIFINVG